MKKLLITGASGFIGSNIRKYFENKFKILTFNRETPSRKLLRLVQDSDIIIHTSAVTRSESEEDFFKINFHLLSRLSLILEKNSNKKVIFFSSIHYSSDGLYGTSKRFGEYIFKKFNAINHNIHIIRLPGVFGEGSKPNNVSVVSTFAYNAIKRIDSILINPQKTIDLIYISDLMFFLEKVIEKDQHSKEYIIWEKLPIITIRIDELNKIMVGFNKPIEIAMNETEQKFFNTYKAIKKKYES